MTKVAIATKPWYTSKLFWLGAAEIVAGVANLVAESIQSGEGWIGIVAGLITIGLRYVTKQPITFTGRDTKLVEK